MASKGCFIDGKWVETSQKLAVISPWSGEVVGEVALAGAGEWEAAIQAAERAAAPLRKMSSLERRQMLEALVAGVKERQAELAANHCGRRRQAHQLCPGRGEPGADDAIHRRGGSRAPGGRGAAAWT